MKHWKHSVLVIPFLSGPLKPESYPRISSYPEQEYFVPDFRPKIQEVVHPGANTRVANDKWDLNWIQTEKISHLKTNVDTETHYETRTYRLGQCTKKPFGELFVGLT